MEANGQEESPKLFEEYLNRQSDWIEKTKGYLMVTATVIAGLNYQTMVNPPGGVWQGDACSTVNQTCNGRVGTAVLEHVSYKRRAYLMMVYSSIVSFYASISLIYLLSSGLQIRNRMVMAILTALMLAAIMCTTFAFNSAVHLVQLEDKEILRFLTVVSNLFYFAWPAISFVIIPILYCWQRRRRSPHEYLPQAASPAQ